MNQKTNPTNLRNFIDFGDNFGIILESFSGFLGGSNSAQFLDNFEANLGFLLGLHPTPPFGQGILAGARNGFLGRCIASFGPRCP